MRVDCIHCNNKYYINYHSTCVYIKMDHSAISQKVQQDLVKNNLEAYPVIS